MYSLMIILALCVIVICSSPASAAAPSTVWEKNYGGDKSDIGYAVWQTSDGGYIIAGRTPNSDFDKLALIKTDANGNKLWSQAYGETGRAYAVRQTSDGGYVFTGYDSDFCVLYKTDASGNEQWHQQFPEGANTNGWSVQQTDDGGYIVAGDVYNTGTTDWDPWILRTDASGNKLWIKTWGGNEQSNLYSVDLTNDGGYIFGGIRSTVNEDEMFNPKPYLVRTDASGNILWETTYNRNTWDNYVGQAAVQQTFDGGFALTTNNGSNFYLMKTDASGNKLWDHDYTEMITNVPYSVQQAWDGGFVIAGFTQESTGNDDMDVLVVRTDASGNQLWTKKIGGKGAYKDDIGQSIIQNGDGYYLVTGSTLTYTTGSPDMTDVFFVKLDKDMTPVPNAQVVSDSIPTRWNAGEAYNVQVTFKNTGTKPWTFQDNISMGYSGDAKTFGVTNQTIRIGKVVRPNQEYTFSFVMYGPTQNGTYNPRIQMAWEGRQMFGAVDNKTITVVNGTPAAATQVTSAQPTGTPTSPATVTEAPTTVPPTSTPGKTGGLCGAMILPLLLVGVVSAGFSLRRKKE
jgi:hypothetical protein